MGNSAVNSAIIQTHISNCKNMNLKYIAFAALMTATAAAAETTVTVTTAGTLASQISADEKFSLTELKVVGPINGTDIGLLRQMCGVALDDYDTPTEGKLTKLDLSEASIVSGGLYLTKRYENGKATANTIGENMFRKVKLQTLLLPQGVTTIANTAFSGSELRSITLPENVTSVGSMAFAECLSLEKAVFPKTVTSIGMECFLN